MLWPVLTAMFREVVNLISPPVMRNKMVVRAEGLEPSWAV